MTRHNNVVTGDRMTSVVRWMNDTTQQCCHCTEWRMTSVVRWMNDTTQQCCHWRSDDKCGEVDE